MTPEELIDGLPEPRQTEIRRIWNFIRETVPDLQPCVMKGMLGFGPYHYRYESGHEGDWFRVGVGSNKSSISIYACASDERGHVAERYRERLPKASIGKSCVRFKRFEDLDPAVVREMLREAANCQFGM